MKRSHQSLPSQHRSYGRSFHPGVKKMTLSWLLLFCCSGLVVGLITPAIHQLGGSAVAQSNVQRQEDQLIRDFALPQAPPQAPVYQPAPAPAPEAAPEPAPAPVQEAAPEPVPAASEKATPEPTAAKPEEKPKATASRSGPANQYVYEFNRSPKIGNRFRLQGTYAESRLNFTRPRGWKIESAKAIIRFQHSPALLANRSNLLVQVNGTSVGSTPLNRKQSQVGEFAVTIPPNLLQNSNEITLVAQQNNDPKCSNPNDPALWTEVLPTSKLVFNYKSQPVALDFSRYPYPFFDEFSLDATQLAYVLPAQMSEAWLTAAGRFQAAMGRLVDYRPLETRLVKKLDDLKWNDRFVVIGTPSEQPILKSLKLPFAVKDNQVLDGSKKPLPGDVGILMLVPSPEGGNPILVVTGNGPEGVTKATQFLAQPQNRDLGTGQAILVNELEDVPPAPIRKVARAVPVENSFKLSDLQGSDRQPLKDMTVRGASAGPIEFDFRALPDDRFTRGSSMKLVYSYGPQVNPRTSAVEVLLDGVAIGGNRLTSDKGANKESYNINLPENLVTPTSKLQIAFRLNSKEVGQCGVTADQQLWGTIHAAETQFNLKRENSVLLPDLKLLQVGYPFAAPQDLSNLAIVLPEKPSNADVLTMLEFSNRMGRLSQADSVKLDAYTVATLPDTIRKERHLVGIGTRDKFPLPEAFQAEGFSLNKLFSRIWNKDQIQTLPDKGGVINQVISPWNKDRVLLALSSQTESGLKAVRGVLINDPWFYQMKGDTVLISANAQATSAYDPDAYQMESLQRTSQRRIENTTPFNKASRVIQENWFLLPTGIVTLCLILYGIAQLYLKRIAGE